MIGTRKESKVSTDGAPEVLTTLLSDEIKKSSFGTLAHGVGNVVRLTEAIETAQSNLVKGHLPMKATLGASAQLVTEELVENSGKFLLAEGLALAGAVAAGVVSAPVTIPALAITSGVLLLAKSKEAGDLANHVVPILADISLDKLKQLKISMTEFVQKAYHKFTRDPSLKNANYQNIEVAMVKMDYLKHLDSQGIYQGLDKNQKLLYNWIARETFSDFIQLNEKGQLKNTKSAFSTRENKINGVALKKELEIVKSALSSAEEKYQITADNKCSIKMTNQEMGSFLLNYGVSPDEIAELRTMLVKWYLKIAREIDSVRCH